VALAYPHLAKIFGTDRESARGSWESYGCQPTALFRLLTTTKEAEMQRLKRQTFSDELHKLVGSKIFSAKFTKKDGSDRVINCMLGVKKHLRGGERTTNKEEFMIVFDTIKKQYRNINLQTLDWIRFNGHMYTVKLQYNGNQLKLIPAESLADE